MRRIFLGFIACAFCDAAAAEGSCHQELSKSSTIGDVSSVLSCLDRKQEDLERKQKNLEKTVRNIRSGLEVSLDSLSVHFSKSVKCTTAWDNGGVTASCPRGTYRVSGGCDFTCGVGNFTLGHTSSLPEGDDGWKCNAISTDTDRTYRAAVVCLEPKW